MSTIAVHQPRIGIAAPSVGAWSETFIAAHLQRLPHVRLVLTDGVLPTRISDGPRLLRNDAFGRFLDRVEARARGTGMDGLLRSRITRSLRTNRIEVLLAEYGTCAGAVVAASVAAGVPLVAHFHGFDAYSRSALRDTGSYKQLFKHAAALVAVSRDMEQQLLTLGAQREKVILSPYGIDVDRFTAGRPGQAPPHFIAVGRFVEKKAPHLTLTAFEMALRKAPDARLTMVGHGPLWESCVQRVRKGPLAGRVDLPGVVDHVGVASLMRTARGFVQHSVEALSGDREGTPLAVLEAMASALPVIASRHAGIADAIEHGVHGLLCAEFDVESMARNMIAIIDDPALAARMGAAGHARAMEHYRMSDSIDRLHAILGRCARR